MYVLYFSACDGSMFESYRRELFSFEIPHCWILMHSKVCRQ